MRPLSLPQLVQDIAAACEQAGGHAYAVGGSVRDHLLGRKPKDWDVEVFGLETDALHRALRPVGRVNEVGRSFGVLKVRRDGQEIDVSVPRRDRQAGTGHRGIQVEADPNMSLDEATRRRDLTVNAMLIDLHSGELVDLHNGERHLREAQLCAVDEETFLEDPLRALRVVQFAARLGARPDPALIRLCRRAPLADLPAERIEMEWRKLLLRGRQLALGLEVARRTQVLSRVFPTLQDRPALGPALDRLRPERRALQPMGRRYALMLAGWLSDTAPDAAEAVLDVLHLHRQGGYHVREAVLATVAALRAPTASDTHLRQLSTRAEVGLVLRVRHALEPGGGFTARLRRALELGVEQSAPPPLLQGRDLRQLGIEPGPRMGEILREAYEQQLRGQLGSADEARRWIRRTQLS